MSDYVELTISILAEDWDKIDRYWRENSGDLAFYLTDGYADPMITAYLESAEDPRKES